MELYHASDVEGITKLVPQISNHQNTYVYFSTQKADIVCYLVNPVRKFCIDNNIPLEKGHNYYRWAVRGFDEQKQVPRIFECWPNAFEDIYAGTPSYFYVADANDDCQPLNSKEFQKNNYYVCSKPIDVKRVEVVADTYKYLKQLESEGKIILTKFENLTAKDREKIRKNVFSAYDFAKYYHYNHCLEFLKNKFAYIF